jgi:SAM-dependent methyltransferase
VRGQGELIEGWLGAPPLRILDVACGMGTQAIGLALRGHEVVARDLSPALIERARHQARRFAVRLDLAVADMRDLSAFVDSTTDADGFDAVIALDNALPHLDTDADLELALRSARQALRPGGRYLASLRDYDRLVEERPRLDPPRVLGEGASRRIVLQHWEWDEDGSGYALDHLILRQVGIGDGVGDARSWTLRARRGRYRALRRASLEGAAERAGLTALRWMEPAESGFYQPIFEARRPA